MLGDGKKRPFGESFVSLALKLFFGMILLVLAVELAKKIWWLLALIGLVIVIASVVRWIAARKKRWYGE